MDLTNVAALTIGSVGSIGAYFGGRYQARSQQSQIATDTVALLSTQITALKEQCDKIPTLQQEINVLRDLVTQRAEVEKVIEIVTRIEGKLDAQA